MSQALPREPVFLRNFFCFFLGIFPVFYSKLIWQRAVTSSVSVKGVPNCSFAQSMPCGPITPGTHKALSEAYPHLASHTTTQKNWYPTVQPIRVQRLPLLTVVVSSVMCSCAAIATSHSSFGICDVSVCSDCHYLQ